ncbi:MAG: GNAT family N-acetyltransferase, partial [Deltaproteobacteria bacterium]|nr:GNAT family N-acetyltransferase [Deltaproteobacteria bacterium]
MTQAHYLIRNAESIKDADGLHDLYSEVFYPEKVGELARTLFHSLPGMEKAYWFIAEEKKTCKIVSAFALLPWIWQMDGVSLKVAEMGLVATRETHRNKGLMKQLNRAFDRTLRKENFHMAIIQGIPGFYHHFGFYYAVDFENHIDFPFYAVPEIPDAGYSIRLGTVEDIDFFMAEDRVTQNAF